MNSYSDEKDTIASLQLENQKEGKVLPPMEPISEKDRDFSSIWETPLAPWGGFNVPCGLAVVRDPDSGMKVLEFTEEKNWARSIVARSERLRDLQIEAEVKPLAAEAYPNPDRPNCTQALVGPIFRRRTSREYYQFGIEGKERLVLYRRLDDEWVRLAEEKTAIPDDYIKLEVLLDGDGIHCRCEQLGVDLKCTDRTYRMGKVGFRALGRAFLSFLKITQTQPQKERDSRRRPVFPICEPPSNGALDEDLPDPVLKETIDPEKLGGNPIFMDFMVQGRYDMLISKDDSLQATTASGQLLWEYPNPLSQIVFSRDHGDHGRLIYGLTGSRASSTRTSIAGQNKEEIINDQMVVIHGDNGKEIAKGKIPEMPLSTRHADFSPTSGRFTSDEGTDIVLREWRNDLGGGGVRLWAYDKHLNLLWEHEQDKAWYGHHYALALEDINRDGRDELLAGGTMYDCEGNVLWEHDRIEEVLNTRGGKHYDAVSILDSTEETEPKPMAFLIAGSAGVYVVNGQTGKTIAVHRIGHAQGQARRGIDQRATCKVRADIPDEQVLVTTRWGNFGIRTLFSARGERLWSIQPDYIPNAVHLRWGDLNTEVFVISSTPRALGFYDGYGRRIKRLSMFEKFWNGKMPRDVGIGVTRMGEDETDLLAVRGNGKIHVFEPADG